MKKSVTFLIPDGGLKPGSLFNALEVLEKANEYYINQDEKPYYDVQIAGDARTQGLLNGVFNILLIKDVSSIEKTDLVIIPGLYHDLDSSLDGNQLLLSWIKRQYATGAELASLCTGAFFLAATGLLRGMECATHWKTENSFVDKFPDVKLRTDRIITVSKGIYTAGGAQSSLNLMLHLVEKFNGREAALYCAKVLQIDINRHSQAPFIIFEGQKEHTDEVIIGVQTYIEQNLQKRISVDELAAKCMMSRRNFVRRFKKATNNPPVEYIQRIKMEAAKRHLERSRMSVTDIMYASGYNDMKAFRTIFKKITGLTPMDYKMKFSIV